jgi:NAD(P)-dependent dehydrogenase (short-subunit alcohol dehydrogenase family)
MATLSDYSQSCVWIIGAAGYLGQACTNLFEKMSARVLCADLPGKAAAWVAASGSRAIPVDFDANEVDHVPGWVSAQIKAHGVPKGLVVLTYASTAKRFDDLSAQDFDSANHGNLTATFFLAREVGRHMAAAGGGSIVLFSSMYGSVSPDPSIYLDPMTPNPIEYGVGKAGIQQMARYFAVHFGKSGVRCNAISPGPFPNPTIQAEKPDFIQRLTAKVPLGRVGQASEIAGAVEFLVSDRSSFITGINLPVDGGWTAW